jgi:hypothetical protein
MNGVITVYVSRDNFSELDFKETIETIRKYNAETLEKSENAKYPIMFVAAKGESSHAELLNLNPEESLNKGLIGQKIQDLTERLEKLEKDNERPDNLLH